MTTTGLVVGRFSPLHTGHLFVLEMASHAVDRLVVALLPDVDGGPSRELRREWVRASVPDARLVDIESDPGAESTDAATIRASVGDGVDALFGSSPRDEALAAALDVRFVPVDPSRAIVPASARAIAEDPLGNWHFLPRCVRAR
ncbi:MAG: adenylyltransferase/cytidyltransferase family protein, partial [Polyangiales bacterium]